MTSNSASKNGSMPAPVRVAVVGLGYWGPNLLRVLHDLPEAEVAYACDRNPLALTTLARRFPAVKCTREFEDVLTDPTVDAVAIATPVGTHYELAAKALRSGKHVFVEKPLSANSRDAEHLVCLADEGGLVLMPGHTFVYSPPVVAIKQMIDAGELGDIYFISSSRVNLGLHQPDVSVIWDLGVHDFAILHYWLNELPTSVSALTRACIIPHIPDVAFVSLRFPTGTVAHIEVSWLAPGKLRRTAIVGSKQMVVYDDTSNEPVRVFDSGVALPDPGSFGEYKLTYRTGSIISPAIAAREPLLLEMSDFCRSIQTGQVPSSSAALGLQVVRIAEAADQSVQSDGEVRVMEAAIATA